MAKTKKKTFAEKCVELQKPFTPDEMSWRVQRKWSSSNGAYAHLLAYVDSRAIFDRLDDVMSPENWRNTKKVVSLLKEEIVTEYKNGKNVEVVDATGKPVTRTVRVEGMIDVLELRNDEGEWIRREDGAEPRDVHSFKSACSDSIKRAAVLWGIGRYLYCIKNVIVKMTPEKPEGKQGEDFEFVRHKNENWYYEIPKTITPYISDSMRDKLSHIVTEIEELEKKYAKMEEKDNEPEPEPEPKKEPENKKESKSKKNVDKKEKVVKDNTPKKTPAKKSDSKKKDNKTKYSFSELMELSKSDEIDDIKDKFKEFCEIAGLNIIETKTEIFNKIEKDMGDNQKRNSIKLYEELVAEHGEKLGKAMGMSAPKKEIKEEKKESDNSEGFNVDNKNLLNNKGSRDEVVAKIKTLAEIVFNKVESNYDNADDFFVGEVNTIYESNEDISSLGKTNPDAAAKKVHEKFIEKYNIS